MIHLSLGLSNPFVANRFKNIFCKEESISENKAYCFEVYKDNDIISFSFNWNLRQDHAGVSMAIGLIGYEVSFQIYDTRHWDYEYNCWEEYDNE